MLFLLPIAGNAQDSVFHFNHLKLLGNRKTKAVVFYREIGYKPGDTIHRISEKLLLFRQRLSGIALFNLVHTATREDTLIITVKERIYTWALPRVDWADRNFNVWWQKKDPRRLIYGGTLYFNNLYGLNHELQVTVIRGYNHLVHGKYIFPFAGHSNGLALIAEARYLQNHELWYRTENNILQFFKTESEPVQRDMEFKTTLRKRLNFFNNLEISAGYRNYSISDSAYAANPLYLVSGTQQQSFIHGVYFNSDHRIQRDYPVGGYLVRAGARGQYVWNKGVQRYFPSLQFRVSHFSALRKNLVLAKMLGGNYTFGKLPYIFTRQLGYQNDYVRGYEPFVADGNGFVLGKVALRKAVLNNYPLNLGRLMPINNYKKMPLSIWFSIFADAGHALKPSLNSKNDMNSKWLAGTGAGMEIILYYSTMMRFDYTMNRDYNRYFNFSVTNAF